MFRRLFLAAAIMLPVSNIAYSDCKATVFADDFNGSLRSVNEVNDWCSKRAGWFRVDTGKYQPKDYCFSSRQSRYDSYGRLYYVYPTQFWFQLKGFTGYYQDDVLRDIHYFLRDFSFKGWPSSVKLKFEPGC